MTTCKGGAIIVADDLNGAIGKHNQLPWRLSADLQRFKSLTMGYPIVMGRKTFESIGRPLPGRRNIVISSGAASLRNVNGIEVYSSLNAAISKLDSYFIIGGARIFEEGLKIVDKIYLTKVVAKVEGADVFLPKMSDDHWRVVLQSPMLSKDEKNDYDYQFIDYQRK